MVLKVVGHDDFHFYQGCQIRREKGKGLLLSALSLLGTASGSFLTSCNPPTALQGGINTRVLQMKVWKPES